MMRRGGTLVLVQDDDYVKYSKLLAKAMDEGRVDGKHRCPVCGMRFNARRDAVLCCAEVPRQS